MHKDILSITSFIALLLGQLLVLILFLDGQMSNIQTLSCQVFLLFAMVVIGILSE